MTTTVAPVEQKLMRIAKERGWRVTGTLFGHGKVIVQGLTKTGKLRQISYRRPKRYIVRYVTGMYRIFDTTEGVYSPHGDHDILRVAESHASKLNDHNASIRSTFEVGKRKK